MPEIQVRDVLPRLAVVTTHPIQYQAPLWRAMAQSGLIDVRVFYASDHGVKERFDPLYEKSFAWDIPMFEGYTHEFLPSVVVPGLPGPVSNRYPRGLSHRLAQGRFQAVLLHGYMNGAAWAGYRAARRLGLPILLRGDSHLNRKHKRVRAMVKGLFLRRFLRGISCCLAIGEWNRNYWQHYGMSPERILTTLYAVDNERFSREVEESRARSQALRLQWGVRQGDVVFAFVGNFQPHKGIDVLLDAFDCLRGQRTDVHLVLIGDGPQKELLQARGADIGGIHWSGFVNQAEMPVYLGAMDMLVLPSRVEPWGLVVNEAMACGVPCIVSDAVGAGQDLVAGPKTGLVFASGDAQALATAMNKSCDDEQRARWRERIPAVLEGASYAHNIRTILDFLLQLQAMRGKHSCGS